MPSVPRRVCLQALAGAWGAGAWRGVAAQPAPTAAPPTPAAAEPAVPPPLPPAAPSDGRARLQAAVQQAAAQAPLTHAVLVAQRGELLAEAYFSADDKPSGDWFSRRVAFDAHTLHDMRSITKSVVALLAGIAHGRGLLDLQRPVMDWFPEHAALATPQRLALRLPHLLGMCTGLEWDETSVSYANLANSETRLGLSSDPVGFVLSRDTVAAPGTRFAYSGGATLLLAEIVARATGQPIDTLARDALFTPLGITAFTWRHHSGWGRPLPYTGLRLAPPAMLQLGQLMLDGGRAPARGALPGAALVPALVPPDWVARLLQPQPLDTGQGLGYGGQWWLGRVPSGPAAGTGWFAGLGNGGQVLMGVPALQATIAVTAGRYNQPANGGPSLAICRRVMEVLVA